MRIVVIGGTGLIGIALRADKTDQSFTATIHLAAAAIN
jgi:hypothetical protein